MPITWGYLRVSTDDQGAGLAAQREAVLGAGVDERFLRIDEGISGATFDRPALNALMGELHKGDTLIVHKLDRIGRSVRGVVNFIADLAERKVELKVISEQIDTTTPHGKFTLHIMLALAEMERDLISSRTKAALAEIKRTGIGKSGQPVTIGRPAKLSPEDREDIRRLREEGARISTLARHYDVCRETIYNIIGKGHRKVADEIEARLDDDRRMRKYLET
jgi:DNA invertase Pin-like site-specific DNA recombinase